MSSEGKLIGLVDRMGTFVLVNIETSSLVFDLKIEQSSDTRK